VALLQWLRFLPARSDQHLLCAVLLHRQTPVPPVPDVLLREPECTPHISWHTSCGTLAMLTLLCPAPLRDEGGTFRGRYLIKGNKVFCVVVYPNSRGTEIRSILKIRSTHAGGARRQSGAAGCHVVVGTAYHVALITSQLLDAPVVPALHTPATCSCMPSACPLHMPAASVLHTAPHSPPHPPPAPGANNRLDIETIYSFDRDLGQALPGAMSQLQPEEPEGEGTRKAYSRGMSPGVFVPWEQVLTTPLNLPPKEMDFYVAG
jgi:hypothetical protein